MNDETEFTAPTPSDTVGRLQEARHKAGWLSWGGIALAVAWWAAAIGGTIALLGWAAISATQPALIIAGTVVLLLPGFMLVMAGFLAREQIRASAANAIVLEAAAKLLTPAEAMGQEALTFANQMSQASAEVDKSMGHALSAMRAMASEIGDERQRLESVTYASADNARDLADRLGSERSALEQLTRELREQTALIGDAVPRQAGLIVESAKAAAQEVAASEEALESRLNNLENTGRSLAQKITAMDTLAAEAGQRNETLLFAIARMEEKLEQSRKTVETASRAGELAAAAAGTTGDRLMEAVRSALEGAREASAEIQMRTLETSESAAKALADLKNAGQQASAAVRAAGMAARAEMDIAERRASQATNALHDTSRSVAGASASSSPPPSRTSDVGAASSLQASPDTRDPAPEASPDRTPEPAARATIAASPARAVDEDLFDASADRIANAMLGETDAAREAILEGEYADTRKPQILQRDPFQADDANDDMFDEDADATTANDTPAAASANGNRAQNGNSNGKNSLSAIIADMERDDQPSLSREETAEQLLDRLQDSGIRLTEIFRPKDKKKVAMAARKGEKQRHSAINNAAGRQVERVRQRLRNHGDLMALSRDFVSLEEADALNALENTHATNKNASARLAAYLLLDAALA